MARKSGQRGSAPDVGQGRNAPFRAPADQPVVGGQQQRIFIARALLQDAEIYLMDEPFAGVDIATEQAIVALMETLKREGKTLFVVHHDLHSVQQYFDWVLILNTSLIASGPVSEVFRLETIGRAYGRNFAFLASEIR